MCMCVCVCVCVCVCMYIHISIKILVNRLVLIFIKSKIYHLIIKYFIYVYTFY